MSAKDNGGPAFPTVDANRPEDYGTSGATLRDYFAIRAYQVRFAKYSDWTLTELTQQAYEDADAMLEARKA